MKIAIEQVKNESVNGTFDQTVNGVEIIIDFDGFSAEVYIVDNVLVSYTKQFFDGDVLEKAVKFANNALKKCAFSHN
jgi:hypothetical protein